MNAIKFILISLLVLSCEQHIKFDKKIWCSYNDLDLHEERNQMLKDLLENYDLKGKSIYEVELFFGCIESIDTINQPFNMQYNVYTNYGWDIDPVHTKTLMIFLDNKFKVKNVKISEWKMK